MITASVSRPRARRSAHALATITALATLSVAAMAACDDAPTQSTPATRGITARGRPPASLAAASLQLSVAEFHFGEIPMSGRSASQSVKVKNVGTVPMHFLGASPRDQSDNYAFEFQWSDDRNNSGLPPWRECIVGDSIVPGDSCEIRIDFTPRYQFGAGARTARLYVKTDAGDGAVDMYGTAIYASDLSVGFGALLDSYYARQGQSVTLVAALGLKSWSAPAKDVVLTMPVPQYTTYASYSAPKGYACTAPKVGGTGALTCRVASFGFADAALAYPDLVGPEIRMVVKVANNAPIYEYASGTATVTSSTYDPVLADDARSTKFQVWPKK
jgi:hypothetical protein